MTSFKLQQCKIQGDIFVVLYSIADKESFRQAVKIGRYLNHFKNPGTPTATVLVGNKNDLEHLRQVEWSQGQELSSELQCLFKEISISERTGYEEVNDVIRCALRQYLALDQTDKKDHKVERRENSSVSYLSKMKEGIMKRTGSMRRKSVAFWCQDNSQDHFSRALCLVKSVSLWRVNIDMTPALTFYVRNLKKTLACLTPFSSLNCKKRGFWTCSAVRKLEK